MVRGVGVVGAGPGAAALHLPTLARLSDHFRVVHVSDGGSGRARELADRVGARSSTGIEQLVADPEVEVVAILSPPSEHAAQILASIAAGKRAIFCEKPLALTSDEVTQVLDGCRRSGTRLVVGTNHLFDPAWGRAKHHLDAAGVEIRSVEITVALPPNDRYHAVVTEWVGDGSPARRPPAEMEPRVAASIVRQLVTGLGIHDLPALRDLVPVIDTVGYARFVPPLGYLISARGQDTLVTLSVAMLPGGADALWRMSIVTSTDRLDVDFPPAFVHAGSARARVTSADGRLTEYHPNSDDGYLAEWRALADLLDAGGVTEFDSIEEDARYVLALAAAAEAAVLAGAGS